MKYCAAIISINSFNSLVDMLLPLLAKMQPPAFVNHLFVA